MSDTLGPILIKFLLDGKAEKDAKRLAEELGKVRDSGVKAGEKLDLGFKSAARTIKDVEADITRLFMANRKGFGDISKMQAYEAKMAELKAELKELTKAADGASQELGKVNGELAEGASGEGAGGFVGNLVSIASITLVLTKLLGELFKAFRDTTAGVNTITKASVLYKQVMYELTHLWSSQSASIKELNAIANNMNSTRERERNLALENAQLQSDYNTLTREASDNTLSYAERIAKLTEASQKYALLLVNERSIEEEKLKNIQDRIKLAPKSLSLQEEELQIRLQLLEIDERSAENDAIVKAKTAAERESMFKKWLDEIEATNKAEEERKDLSLQIGRQEKLLREAAIAGNLEEVKAIAEKIRLMREELSLKTQLAKAAILQSVGGAPQKINISTGSIPALYTGTRVLPGLQGPSAEQTKARGIEIEELGKARQWNQDNEASLDNQAKLWDEIITGAGQLTSELASQLGLSEQEAAQLDAMVNIASQLASGNYIGAGVTVLQTLITNISETFPGVMRRESERLERKIAEINRLLEDQRELIDESGRYGGQKEAVRGEGNLIQQEIDANNAAIAKAQKVVNSFWRSRSAKGKAENMIEKLTEDNKDLQKELDKSKQDLEDLIAGGITENVLADTIAQGFIEGGKTGIDSVAEYMNDVLKNAAIEIFKGILLDSPKMKEYQDYVAQAFQDNVLTQEEKDRIIKYGQDLSDSMKPFWDNLIGTLDFPGDEQDVKSLSGAIKGVTEETASVVAGQMNAMRINQVEINNLVRQQLMHLSEIALNSRYNKHLESIDAKLDILQTDSSRASGIL